MDEVKNQDKDDDLCMDDLGIIEITEEDFLDNYNNEINENQIVYKECFKNNNFQDLDIEDEYNKINYHKKMIRPKAAKKRP